MGVCVPEEYGGAGADFLSYILVLEELSRADAGVGVTVAVHTSAVHAAAARVRDRRAARALRAAARPRRADRRVRADRARGGLRCRRAPHARATPDGDGWRITGASSGSRTARTRARSCSSRAPTRRRPAPRGVSAFVLDAEHVRVTRDEEKLGLNSSYTNDIAIEGAPSGATACCTRRARASRSRWRRSTADGSGSRRRRSGSRRRRSTSRASTRRSGARSASRSASTRRSSSSSPTWRRRSTRRACSSTAPPG